MVGQVAGIERSLECPLCKAKVLLVTPNAVEGLQSNFSAARLIEVVRLQEQAASKEATPICQHCDDGEAAISSCGDCCIFLCDFCDKSHKKAKVTKEHRIFSLDDMRRGTCEVSLILSEKFQMCPTHPTKPLELFCKCEDMLICRDCIIKKHKDHDYDVVSDVVEDEKKVLKEALSGIQQLIGEIENAVTDIKNRKENTEMAKKESLKRLDDIFCILHAAIDERKEQLREQLIEESKEKNIHLQEQEDELRLLIVKLQSCSSFFDDMVERGIGQDMLAMKRLMLKRKDELTEAICKTILHPVVQKSLPISPRLKRMDQVLKLMSQLEVMSSIDYIELKRQNHQTVTHYGGSEFESLHSIAIGSNNEVILLHNKEVMIFDKDLQLIRTFGGDSQLNYPIGVAAGDTLIAVSDWEDHTVKKFSLQGDFLSKFGSHGSADGQFNHPQGLCFNTTKCLLYVVDNHNSRVQVFRDDNTFSLKFGELKLRDPHYIALDSSNNIYVTDSDDNHGGIYVFNDCGLLIQEICCKDPFPIAIGLDDYIMTDGYTKGDNQCVNVLYPRKGYHFCVLGSFHWVLGIAVNSSGTIFVITNNCLHYYIPSITS